MCVCVCVCVTFIYMYIYIYNFSILILKHVKLNFPYFIPFPIPCPFGWGCRIDLLLFWRGVRLPINECPGYDTKQSDGEVPIMLKLWRMQSTPSLPLLPGPLWPGGVAPARVLSIVQIELKCVLMLN